MPKYSVHIGEPLPPGAAALESGASTAALRNVFCAASAEHEEAAKAAGWRAWDEKYGPGRQRVQAIVKVTRLED